MTGSALKKQSKKCVCYLFKDVPRGWLPEIKAMSFVVDEDEGWGVIEETLLEEYIE